VRIVLVGPPGAGKGTQAQLISEHLSIPHISTGDIFRANVKEETQLGKLAKQYMDRGDLVPDEVTIAMVKDRLAKDDAKPGFLLDGFPRNVPQAETLKSMLAEEWGETLDVVLQLIVDEEEVVRRLSGRRTCRQCGRISHVVADSTETWTCRHCGGELYQRDDDKEETVRHRLEVYKEQTSPLVSFYRGEGILVGINATGPVEEVTKRALAALQQPAKDAK
jgi:adenylate kinase